MLIKPSPTAKLESAAATYDTVRGRIGVEWSQATEAAAEDGSGRAGVKRVTMKVTIPPNVAATVHVPSTGGTPVLEAGGLEPGRNR